MFLNDQHYEFRYRLGPTSGLTRDYTVLDRGHCHPLTALDEHSRFAVGLEACGNERGLTVRERLTNIFGRYGLAPQHLLNPYPMPPERTPPFASRCVPRDRSG